MHLKHELGTLVELVNSAPPAAATDTLATLAGVRAFISRRIVTNVSKPRLSDISALRLIREHFRAIVGESDESIRIRLVNTSLASATMHPRLAIHDGLPLHLHFFPKNAAVAEHLLADCSVAVAELMVAGEGSRLKLCAVDSCGRAFFDQTRNRSRTYCDSRRCGNRLHAAAYRRRKISAEAIVVSP